MKTSTLALSVVGVLLLAGCSATGQQAVPNSGEKPAAARQAPADAETVPNYPAGFDCAAIGRVVEPFTQGLVLNHSTEPSVGEELWCIWGSKAESDFKGTALDVSLTVRPAEQQTASRLKEYCTSTAGKRKPAAAIDALGGCARGSLLVEGKPNLKGQVTDEVKASIPYFDLYLNVSCQSSVLCRPALPSSYTDANALAALGRLAEKLAG